MSRQICTGGGGGGVGAGLATSMDAAGAGDPDWPPSAPIDGRPEGEAGHSDINNNNNNNIASASASGVSNNGCTFAHNEIMKMAPRWPQPPPPLHQIQTQLQSQSPTRTQQEAAGDQMITKIREKGDLGQLVLNVSFASVGLVAGGLADEQVHESEPRIEVRLCIKQRESGTEAHQLSSDTCGSGREGGQVAGGERQECAPSKRRLVYECIDQFQLSLAGAASNNNSSNSNNNNNNKWPKQRPLLPFAAASFDACFCFNLLNVRLTSGRHLALERALEPTSGQLGQQPAVPTAMQAATKRAFQQSWADMERLTGELRLRLLRELSQTVKPGGKIMIIVFAYECQRRPSEATGTAASSSSTSPSIHHSHRGRTKLVPDQPLHGEESAQARLGDTEVADICCPRCRLETLERRLKAAHSECIQPFEKLPAGLQSAAAAESPLLAQADGEKLMGPHRRQDPTARFIASSRQRATGVEAPPERTKASYSSSLRQALGASVDLSDSRAAEKLGDAAKRLGRRLSLGGMSLLVRLSNFTNPFPAPQTNDGPQMRKPTSDQQDSNHHRPATNQQPAAREQSIDKLARDKEQLLSERSHHKLLNDETQEEEEEEEPHVERDNLLPVFEGDEFARRHRQSIAVQSFFTKSIKVQEDEDEHGCANEDIKMEVQQSAGELSVEQEKRAELARGDSDPSRKQQRPTNEHNQLSPTCSRGSHEVSCSSNEGEDDDVDSTTSGWTAPTSGATNASLGGDSCEASSAPIERSSSSSGQQQQHRRFPVSSRQLGQHQQANNKLDNTDKIAGDNVCSSAHHANRLLATRHPANPPSGFGEPSVFPVGTSFQHHEACQDHNANNNGLKQPPRRHCSAGAAGEYATPASASTDRNNNDNNNNNNNQLSWFAMMPATHTTTPTTNLSLNNRSASPVASGLNEPARPRLVRLEEAASGAQHQQQPQRRAFSDTDAAQCGAHNSFDSFGRGPAGTPNARSVELDVKAAAAAAVAAGLSLGMARAHLLHTESGGRLIRSAELTQHRLHGPAVCSSNSNTTTNGTPDRPQPLEQAKLVHNSTTTTTDGPTSGELTRSSLIRCVGQASGHRYRPLQEEARGGGSHVSSGRYQDHDQWCHSTTFNGSNPNSDMSTSGGVGGSGGDGTGGVGGGTSSATVPKSDTTDKDSSRRTSTLSGISSIYQQEISLFTQHSLDGGGGHGSSTPANSSGALMGSIPELASAETPHRYPFLASGSSGDPLMMMNGEPPEPPAPSPLATEMPGGAPDELGTNLQRVAASLRSQLRERFSSTMRPLNAFMMGRSLAGESDETSSIQEEEPEALEFEQQATLATSAIGPTGSLESDRLEAVVEAAQTTDSLTSKLHHQYKPPDAPKQMGTRRLNGGLLVRAQSKTDTTSPSSPLKSFFRSKSSAAFNAFASSFQHQSSSSTTPTVTTVLTRQLAASGSLASDVFESLKSPGGPAGSSRLSNQASFGESQAATETPGAVSAAGRSPLSPLSVTSTRFFSKIRDKFSLPNHSARHTASEAVREEASTQESQVEPVQPQSQLAYQPPRPQPLPQEELLRPPIWEDLLYANKGTDFEEPTIQRHLLPPVLEQQQPAVSPSNNQEWTEVSQMSIESSCSARSLHSCWFSMPELHALSYDSILNPPRNKRPQGLDLFMNLQVSGAAGGQQQQEIAGEWPANELYKQIVEGGETAPDWSLSDLNLTSEDIAPRVANQPPPLIPLAALQPPGQQQQRAPQVPLAIQQQFQHHNTLNLTKGATLDDSVCASMHSSLSNDAKPANNNNNNNSRPESQNSTLSNASGALSELNSSGTHSPLSGSPVRPASQPLANEESAAAAGSNRDEKPQQQLLTLEPASGGKARAMSLVPGYGTPPKGQQQADGHTLATSRIEAANNRRRSTNACLGAAGRPLDPNVAPAAASLRLRLAARNNRVKLSDLHPITFINDHQFLSSMSSLKRADNAKLNAIFNSPVARRLSINAAEQSSASAALGSARASIKIGLTGYVYIESAKPEAGGKQIRRPSLAPDFWRNQAQEASANSLAPGSGPKRQRAASCAPLGPYPSSVSPQPEAAINTKSPEKSLSGIAASSDKPVGGGGVEQHRKTVSAPSAEVPAEPPLAVSSEPDNEEAKRGSGDTTRTSSSSGSSSSDDGDLDKLIAQYDRPTSVAGPQADLHNDQLLRQMLLVACDQSASPVCGARHQRHHHPHHPAAPQPAPATSRRRYSAINLYQRDEDMFVANSMRWQASRPPPPLAAHGKTLMTRDVIGALAPLTRAPIQASAIKVHHQHQHNQLRAQLPVMEATVAGAASTATHYPVRSIISGSSGRPLGTLARMGSSISSTLVAGVDVEEQLNRLRQQERRSLSGCAVGGGGGGGGGGGPQLTYRPPWSSEASSPPPPSVSQASHETHTHGSSSFSPAPQTDLAGIMSSLILSGPQKSGLGCADSSTTLLDELCGVETLTEEEEEEEVEEERELEEQEGAGAAKRDTLETPAEEPKPATPTRPRLPDIHEAQVVASSAGACAPAASRFLSPLASQSAPRSPPHSPLSLMASSGAICSAGLAYSASKSCEPFKQLDTIIEGRGLLLGAEQQADPNYANMLRRLSGNHSRRSSISSTSVIVDEAPSLDGWCRCEMSPARRRSTLTRIEPLTGKLGVASPVQPQPPPLPPPQSPPPPPATSSETLSFIFTTNPPQDSAASIPPSTNLLGSAGPRSMLSQMRSLAQRTLSNLAPRFGAAVVPDSVTQVFNKTNQKPDSCDRPTGDCLSEDDASSVTGSADHSSMLSLAEEEDEQEYEQHLNRRETSQERATRSPDDEQHSSSSSSSSYNNTCSDTSPLHSQSQNAAPLASSEPASSKSAACASARRESAEKLAVREEEHAMVCHRCNRKIRLGRPEEFADYEGELEDEEMDVEVEVEGEGEEEEEAYNMELDGEEDDEDEDDDDLGDEDEDEEDDEEEMELEEEEEEELEGDEPVFPNRDQHQREAAGRKRARRSGKRARARRKAHGSTEALSSGDTGDLGKLYLAVPPRRKYKWHIKRNLAPKLKRQRSFSANYAPEVPITLIPPPRRFSAAPTLTCPHRNKSSSHSSSSLHHTYSIDSSESMITVIPSNRNQEFMRGTSRSSLSCTDGGSLYMLPKSPMSPRSPSRCSPAGLLTPNTSEHPPLSPVSPAGYSAMRMINSHGSLADIVSGRRQSQPELGAGLAASALQAGQQDQDRFKSNQIGLIASNNAAPANLLSDALHELSFQQQQQLTNQDHLHQQHCGSAGAPPGVPQPAAACNPATLKADPNSDRTIVYQTINEFCHKHSKLELEYLIQQLGYLKISESYFSEKSSTLCIVIEVKEE